MRIYNCLLSIIFVTANQNYASAKSFKSELINEIINKMANVSTLALLKAPPQKREHVLQKIELKLSESAKHLVDGDKYVNLIMSEFRDKACGRSKSTEEIDTRKNSFKTNASEINESFDTKENNAKEDTDFSEENMRPITVDEGNDGEIKKDIRKSALLDDEENTDFKSNQSSTENKILDKLTKERIIMDIANKIETMAKIFIKDNQPLEKIQSILKKIEEKIRQSSKRHLEIHHKHDEIKLYTELLAEGLELSMKRLLVNRSRRMGSEDSGDALTEKVFDHDTRGVNIKEINKYKSFFAEVLSDASIDPRCTGTVESVCIRIDSLHKMNCGDGKIITLDQLCDGVFDCWNEADETNCTSKVIEKIKKSIGLLSEVDKSITSTCLKPLAGGQLFAHYHASVLNMLESQLQIFENYRPKDKYNISNHEEALIMKNMVGDASGLVNSLSSALDITLCTNSNKPVNEEKLTRKFLNKMNKINDLAHTWSAKSCICKLDMCENENCDVRCKRICSQIYSLNRFKCKSVAGGASITMDLLCDGKLDCFDESDESLCSHGDSLTKHTANTIFTEVLDLTSLKSLSTEYQQSRIKLVALTGLVRQLQKLTTRTNYDIDIDVIKTRRDDIFKMLVNIFVDSMSHSNVEELDHCYDFLMSLNEKLVEAMKKSHTGNENVMPKISCYCRDGACGLVKCSRTCNLTCSVEPVLTRYDCNIKNETVHIKAICNGTNECSNGEDEKNCKNDICRGHQLIILRRKLQKTGLSLRGTVLGEALDSWKSKVLGYLKVAERGQRPNHKMLENNVENILHDLVASYVSMEEFRRHSEHISKEFITVADTVKNMLKSCANK